MVNFTRGFTKGGMWCDRDLLLFDRTRLGRVRRGPFWLTMAAYVLLYAAAFVIPFEIGYRLEVEPDSLYMKIFLNTWMLGFFVSIIPVVRMTRRRLHDAGFSGWWMLLGLIPAVGWAAVVLLLLFPSTKGLGRYDRFVEEDRRRCKRA